MKSKKVVGNILYTGIMLLCFYWTMFIFLSSYETVFSKDISRIHTVEKVSINSLITSFFAEKKENTSVVSIEREYIGNFGIPAFLKIPKFNTRLQLAGAMRDKNGNWLSRLNSGHYMFLSKNKGGNIGDIALYTRKSWRTVNEPQNLKIGDNIFLDTFDDWRYMFRINEARVLSWDEKSIVSESKVPILVLIIEDAPNRVHYFYKADFINIQNIQQ